MKEIHVSAYTKSDGTHVKEHFRTIDSDGYAITSQNSSQNFNSSPVLTGGVSTGRIDWGNIGSAIGQVAVVAANVAIKAAPIALQMYQAVQSRNTSVAENLKPQFESSIKGLEETQKIMKQNLDNNLNKLTSAKNQDEYANLYKSFTKENETYKRTADSITRIKYAAENQDYETVVNELDNYKNIQNNVISESFMNNQIDFSKMQSEQNPQQYKPDLSGTNYAPMPSPYQSAHMSPNWLGGFHQAFQNQMDNLENSLLESPESIKSFLDDSLNKINRTTHGQFIQDGTEFWNASSPNNMANPYMNDNGVVINNVHEIPSHELKMTIASKLQKQRLSIDKTKGIVFYQDSHISNEIAHSKEFKTHILKNKDALLKGSIIAKSGLSYSPINPNTWGAIGKADIINTYIDEYGNIISKVIDTYDFNPKDSRILVRMGKAIQDAGMIEPYFSVIPIKIPKKIWSQWK